MGSRSRFRDVLAIHEFRALWAAEALSVLGDQLARVALAVLVFEQTSSASWTALTYALTFVPAFLGGVVLSGFADRRPRRELMVLLDMVRAVLAGLTAISGLPLVVLISLVFLLTMAGGPFKAAQQALLPQILGDRLEAGLALRTVTAQLSQLSGFAGGSAIMVLVEPHFALGLNSLTFAAAAGLVALGVQRRPAPSRPVDVDDRDSGVLGAMRLIWRDRQLRGLIALTWLVGLFVVPEGLAAPYAVSLGAVVASAGLLMAADPVGSVVGAWVIARIPASVHARLITPLAVTAGLPLIACLFRLELAIVVVLWAVSGACSTAYLLLAQAAFVRRVPDHRRGAAAGLASTGLLTSQGVAILAGGVLADALNPGLAISIAGSAGVLLTGLVATTWLRARRRGDAMPPLADGHETFLTSPGSSRSSSAPPPEGTAAEHGRSGASSVIIAQPPMPTAFVTEPRSPSPWRWAIWKVPRRALVVMLAVECATLGLVTTATDGVTFDRETLIVFGVILGLGVAMGEATRHVEQRRRRFNDTPHVNLTSVWTMSAALMLPSLLAVAVVVCLYQHLFWRSWSRVRGVHAYRLVYTACTVILASFTARAICRVAGFAPAELTDWTSVIAAGAIAAAIVAYASVNLGLVAVAISLFEGRFHARQAFGTWRESELELATLGLGAAGALAVSGHPAFITLLIPAVLALHRSVLMRQLEEAAATDAKTGLTNATAWTSIATVELERAVKDRVGLGVLMIDLDHFKQVNDTFGHLVGDRVLAAVAHVLKKSVRRHDVVGRWGGEEFVVLCPEVSTEEELRSIGLRICEAVRELSVRTSPPGEAVDGLTVSIGTAAYPGFGPDLNDILLAADDALFAAKDAGRNQVQSIITGIGGGQ